MGPATMEKIILGIPRFNGECNFDNWCFRVRMVLDAESVMYTITEDPPSEEKLGKEMFDLADRKAKCLLVSFLADQCLEIVRDAKTAKQMWTNLNNVFAKKSVVNQTILRKQLARLRMEEGSSIREHLQSFDDLVRQLRTAGANLVEADIISQLFLSLPDSYDPLITALENISEKDLSVDFVK